MNARQGRAQPAKRRAARGFTLLEVMVVVAIIGILAAIAYPSYLEHVRKARRADAASALMELAQFMERYYTANGKYVTGAGAAPDLPFTEAPKDGSTKYYDLSFSATPTASGYTLQAAPKGAMSADACGTLTLASSGAKGYATGGSMSKCWTR